MWQLIKKQSARSRSPYSDRRRMERIRMLLTINCQSHEQTEPFKLMTENINVNGIKFISSIKLFIGEVVSMNMLLHSHFPNINVKGRVVWCDKKSMYGKSCFEGGMEFIAISREDKIYLQKFIDKYRVDEFDPAV